MPAEPTTRPRGIPHTVTALTVLVAAAAVTTLAALAFAAAPRDPTPPATAPATAAAVSRAPIADARGIIVSCWRWGYEWADPAMRDVMATLPAVGANWVAIHPYAHVSAATGEVRWSTDERTDHVRNPIRWARELGLSIVITPHISYWGEFPWRGDVGWGDDQVRWERFRTSYRGWILHLAKVCAEEGADLYVVGTELRQTEAMTEWWQGIIRDVRAIYSGPLTYASNWDDFERVQFWKQLDYVGVQAYFPLTSEATPNADQLRAGWAAPIASMRRVARAAGRPILLTELGYPNADWAAATPWKYAREMDQSPALQALCLETALAVVHETDEIAGAFLWKWFPTTDDLPARDFVVQSAPLKRLLSESWRRGVPTAPTPTTTPVGARAPPPAAAESPTPTTVDD